MSLGQKKGMGTKKGRVPRTLRIAVDRGKEGISMLLRAEEISR